MAQYNKDTSNHADIKAAVSASCGKGDKLPTIRFCPAYDGGLCNLGGESWPVPVVFDLDGVDPLQGVPVLLDHDPKRKLGQTTEVRYDGGRVEADGILLYKGVSPYVDDVLTLVERGCNLEASIRTNLIAAEDRELIADGVTCEINGRKIPGPIEVVRRWRLREISVVSVGANAGTRVDIAATIGPLDPLQKGGDTVSVSTILSGLLKSKKIDKAVLSKVAKAAQAALDGEENDKKDAPCEDGDVDLFSAWLAKVGLDPATLSEDQLAVLKLVFEADAVCEDAPKTDEEKPKEAAAEDADPPKTDEEKPKEAAASIAAPNVRTATVAQLRTRSYDSYPGPARGSSNSPNVARVAECALLSTGGLSGEALERVGFDAREIDAATTRDWQGTCIHSLGYKAGICGASDYRDAGTKIARFIGAQSLRNAADPTLLVGGYKSASAAGSLSNVDIPNVLANVMYKALLYGYKMIDDPTDKLSKVIDVKDFKSVKLFTLEASGEFAKIKDNGDLENLKLSDAAWSAQAETKGFELRLPYEVIVNDDLNALVSVNQILGRKALIRKQKLWWQQLKSAMQSVTSVSSNPTLSIDAISAARKILAAKTDADGDPMGLGGKYLIVPPALYDTAANIQNGSVIVAGGGNTKFTLPAVSNVANTFETISSPFIGSGAPVSTWGDAAWCLLCDPADAPLMITSYLNGKREPTLKSVMGDFEISGLKIGVWMSYGVSTGETKAACYSTGSGT